ncbi:MAG: class I SAM-dependent methyltransferase [Acidobacteriota bacterium]
MATQQVDLVRRQFEVQLDQYTNEKRVNDTSRTAAFLASTLGQSASGASLRICEFGGADGILLRHIREALPVPVELWNAEVVAAFRDKQALPDIHFVETSILAPAFAEGFFDVVIARNVMHHLIGTDLAESRSNQLNALKQMRRVTRSGGFVIIEEQVNQSAASAKLLYYMSRLASRMKLSIPRFEITPYTIVAFLTQDELEANVRAVVGEPDVIEYERYRLQWHWKMTMLLRDTGIAFVAARPQP